MKNISDFFNKMPCIVDISISGGRKEITEQDELVRVQYEKNSYPHRYTVYYLARLFNDDRVYKCAQTFLPYQLPEIVQQWMEQHEQKEYPACVRWK